MEYITLIGILIVIVGFALKLDNILTIMAALIVTGLVGGLGVDGLLETLGKSFIDNRNMTIFILVMLVTGTLERSGSSTDRQGKRSICKCRYCCIWCDESDLWSIQCRIRRGCRICKTGYHADGHSGD